MQLGRRRRQRTGKRLPRRHKNRRVALSKTTGSCCQTHAATPGAEAG
jgi:hypothetical protein